LWSGLLGGLLQLIPADRGVGTETRQSGGTPEDHLLAGRWAHALRAASLSPDNQVRRRLERLKAILAGEPFYRPPFAPVEDPQTNEVYLREMMPDGPDLAERDLSLERRGRGVVEVYSILSHIILSGAALIGIEEPEVHLHAPTTGRQLRAVLRRLVEQKDIQQLFITTHSNLFDLDPTGYFDVAYDDVQRATRVERKGLESIDPAHLYEPGPAKHILQKYLGFGDPNEVMFHRASDGAPITAQEMLTKLQDDDPEAVDFLRVMHSAALRAVHLSAKKVKEPTPEGER